MFKANNYMITVVELNTFQRDADNIFSDDERNELIDFISANPHFGDIIPATGGVRKLRWRAKGHGKSRGARVIYYFRDLNIPVFVLAAYAKGEKLNLTMGERDQMRSLVDSLIAEYQAKQRNVIALQKGSA